MSFWSSIEHAVVSVSEQVFKTIVHAASIIEHDTEQAMKAVADVAAEGLKEAESGIWKGITAVKNGVAQAAKKAEKFGENVAVEAEEVGEEAVDEFKKDVTKAWNEIKHLAEEMEDAIIGELAEEIKRNFGDVIQSLSSNYHEAFAKSQSDVDKLQRAIRAGNPEQAIEAIEALYTDVSPLRDSVHSVKDKHCGSAVLAFKASAANGVSVSLVEGIAINIDALVHFLERGSFREFLGNIASFFAAEGIGMGVAAGAGVDIMFGWASKSPDKFAGPALKLNLKLDVEEGGTISIGFGLKTMPPTFSNILVGVSGGAEVKVTPSLSYTEVLAMLDANEGKGRYTNPSNKSSTPNAEGSKNPRLYWQQFKWNEISADNQHNLAALGCTAQNWGRMSRDGTTWDVQVWNDLSQKQREAAWALGISEDQWYAPSGFRVWEFLDPTVYWGDGCYTWSDFLEHEAILLQSLGWNPQLWDDYKGGAGITLPLQGVSFEKLSITQKQAVVAFGYDAERWNKAN